VLHVRQFFMGDEQQVRTRFPNTFKLRGIGLREHLKESCEPDPSAVQSTSPQQATGLLNAPTIYPAQVNLSLAYLRRPNLACG
jgi:hypothetical protein